MLIYRRGLPRHGGPISVILRYLGRSVLLRYFSHGLAMFSLADSFAIAA